MIAPLGFAFFLFISVCCGLVGVVAALPFGATGWGPFAAGVMSYFFIVLVNMLSELREGT